MVNPLYLDLNLLARLPYLRRSTEGVVNAAGVDGSNSTDRLESTRNGQGRDARRKMFAVESYSDGSVGWRGHEIG